MSLEYCLSGMGYLRIYRNLKYPEVLENVKKNFYNDHHGVELTCLFNGYVEKIIGQSLFSYEISPKIYSDSGGLQMVLHGKNIDKDMRHKIYDVQGRNSHLAFCFDDIPLLVDDTGGASSKRTTTDNKTFMKSLNIEKATDTARNIKEQIDYFKSIDSLTKVILIIQGNCCESMTEWCDTLYKEIPKSYYSHIHGIALADTCIGNDLLETIDMIRVINNVKFPDHIKKNVHFLGIGSLSRALPIIELNKGLYSDYHFSFDSTSHTSSYIMGKYINKKLSIQKIGKFKSPFFISLVDEVVSTYLPQYDNSELKNLIIDELGTTKYTSDDEHILQIPSILFVFYFGIHNIRNFTSAINLCCEDPNNYYKFIKKQTHKIIPVLTRLRELKSAEELDKWYHSSKQYIPSKRIAATISTKLEGI